MAFKTMEWIRKVRDDDYKVCKKMGAKEKIEHTRAAAKKLTAKKKSPLVDRRIGIRPTTLPHRPQR